MTRPIKTIVVSLNNPQFLENNLRAAETIARQFDSHVIGLYVIPSAIVFTMPYAYGGPINNTEMNRHFKAQAGIIEKRFQDFVQLSGINGEWRLAFSAGHLISDTIIEHGRESDLIILGHNSSVRPALPEIEFQGSIVNSCGRPVIVVPNIKMTSIDFNDIILSWDGSREASRAAFDAVPLLKNSKVTTILCINPDNEPDIVGDTPGSEIAEALARYDVNVVVETIRTKKSVSKVLMEQAKSADLLVMGAYSHRRLRQNLFGGTTKRALSELPCPVFLSN